MRALCEQVVGFYPNSKGCVLKLSYSVLGTNPREFRQIRSNAMYMEMLNANEVKKAEMFLTLGVVFDDVNRSQLVASPGITTR